MRSLCLSTLAGLTFLVFTVTYGDEVARAREHTSMWVEIEQPAFTVPAEDKPSYSPEDDCMRDYQRSHHNGGVHCLDQI